MGNVFFKQDVKPRTHTGYSFLFKAILDTLSFNTVRYIKHEPQAGVTYFQAT